MFGFHYRLGSDLDKLPSRQLFDELKQVGFKETADVLVEDDWIEYSENNMDETSQEKIWWTQFFDLSNAAARQVDMRLSIDSQRTHYAALEYI